MAYCQQTTLLGPEDVFLQSKPSEVHLQHNVCPHVGRKWRDVATYLDIPRTKVEYILESHRHNVEEAFFRVLCHWRGGKEATWAVLLSALREAELKALASELLEWGKSGAASFPAPDIELQSQAALLKEQAYDEYQQFKLGEGPKANVEYTKLAVLERPPSSRPNVVKDKMKAIQQLKNCGSREAGENAACITPIDLLKKGGKRIQVVYGQAGSGKTTLLKHMCRALACGEVDSDFQLVLFFPLRDRSVSGAGDLHSLLRYYLQDEDPADTSNTVKLLKGSKGRGLLMLFDGADEAKDLLKPSSGAIIQSLLDGRLLPEAHIIVSSRPGACPSLQGRSDTFFEVQGFDHSSITLYVRGFFKTNPAAADKMLSELATRLDLLGVAYIPMNCFILCSIFELSNSSFPATLTACYQAFVCDVLTREYCKEGVDWDLDPSLKSLPRDVQSLLHSLGVLSFQGLLQFPPQFVFDHTSIRSAFSLAPGVAISESLFKGLLHTHAGRGGAYRTSYSFSFPHSMQQEFFAALHLSWLDEGEQVQFWRDNLFNVSHSVVLRFFAGLTGLSNPKVADLVCYTSTGVAEGGDNALLVGECSSNNPQLLFVCHALHESQNAPLIRRVMEHVSPSIQFDKISLSSFDTLALSHCLTQCSHLELLDPCRLLSAACLRHLKAVLQSNPQCQLTHGLDLHCDQFSADDAEILSQMAASLKVLKLIVSHTGCAALCTVCSLPGVREFRAIVRNVIEDSSKWHHVEKTLAENKCLECVVLEGCNSFLYNIGKSLARNTSIKALILRRQEPLPDAVAGAFGTCVTAMTQLGDVWMDDLPLPVFTALTERKEPLKKLWVWPPGVNWDGLSEDQWKKVEEAAANAKVRKVDLCFNAYSQLRSRAVQAIGELARNKTIEAITLWNVPEVMKNSIRQNLQASPSVTVVTVD